MVRVRQGVNLDDTHGSIMIVDIQTTTTHGVVGDYDRSIKNDDDDDRILTHASCGESFFVVAKRPVILVLWIMIALGTTSFSLLVGQRGGGGGGVPTQEMIQQEHTTIQKNGTTGSTAGNRTVDAERRSYGYNKENNGATFLMDAASMGQWETVQDLLDKGVYIEHQNNFGQTVLILAANSGPLEIVQDLLIEEPTLSIKTITEGRP